MRRRGLWEVSKEKQVHRILPRTGRCTVRFEEGGDILRFLALEDTHELTGSPRTYVHARHDVDVVGIPSYIESGYGRILIHWKGLGFFVGVDRGIQRGHEDPTSIV